MSDVYRYLEINGFHTVVMEATPGLVAIAHTLTQQDGEKVANALNFIGSVGDRRVAALRDRLNDALHDAVEGFFDDIGGTG